MNILLAEDIYPKLMYLQRLLTAEGHRVVGTANGEEAIAAASRETFELIVTDFHMPKMSGLEVIRTLRARGIHTPIIVCSEDMDRIAIKECMNAGAMAFLRKPFAPRKLLSLVEQIDRQNGS